MRFDKTVFHLIRYKISESFDGVGPGVSAWGARARPYECGHRTTCDIDNLSDGKPVDKSSNVTTRSTARWEIE